MWVLHVAGNLQDEDGMTRGAGMRQARGRRAADRRPADRLLARCDASYAMPPPAASNRADVPAASLFVAVADGQSNLPVESIVSPTREGSADF
jgi:hypothetical protein